MGREDPWGRRGGGGQLSIVKMNREVDLATVGSSESLGVQGFRGSSPPLRALRPERRTALNPGGVCAVGRKCS